MAYVVAIELDNKQTNYKVFTRSADAIRLYNAALDSRGGSIVLRGGEEATVLGCKMYKTATADVRESVRLVKEGKAERFFRPLSDLEEKQLDELSAPITGKPANPT